MKYRNLLTIGLFFLSAGLMNSQTSNPTRPDRGFYPNGSFAAGEFDTINNVNGNVIARVPITNLAPGRGGAQFGVNLTYNSAIYDTTGVVNTAIPSGFPVVEQRLKQSEHGGWQLGYQYGLEYETRASSGGVCNTANQPVYKVHKMSLRTPDGSLHTLRLHAFSDYAGDGFYGIGPNKERSCASDNPDTAPPGDLVYTTTDGSFIRVEIGYSSTLPGCTIPLANSQYWTCRLWRVFLPDGSEVRGYGKRPIIMVDRNGNEVYLSSFVAPSGNTVDLIEDQMGRFIEVEKFVSPRKDVVRRLGHGSQTLVWEIHYATIQSVAGVYYKCGSTATDPSVYCDVTGPFASHEVITKVTFPTQTVNGTNYSFDFEYATAAQNGWGELRRALFPSRLKGSITTRATIDYEYLWDNYTVVTMPQAGAAGVRDVTLSLENPVKKRTLSYTGGDNLLRTEVWDYQFTPTSSITTLPDGSTHTANFYDVRNPWRWDRGLVYGETLPLNRSVTRTWQRNPPLSPIDANAPANAYVSSETSSLGTRGNQAKTTTRSFTVDRNGNQTLGAESDWLTSPLRTTQGIYLYPTTNATGAVPTVDEVNAYWRAGVRRSLRAVKRQRTIDANSVTRSLAEFTYDTNWNVTQSRQWDSTKAVTAPAETAGDILLAGNSVIQQSTFTTTGNPTAAVDANNNQTTLSYGMISGCSPTQPTVTGLYATARIEGANNLAIQRSFALAYDCNSGLVTSETDTDNSVATSRAYDAFGRPTAIYQPDSSATAWTYQDGNYRTAESHDVNSTLDQQSTTIRHFDDLGRLFLQQSTAINDIFGFDGRRTSKAQPALADATPVNGILVDRLYAPPACRTPGTCDNYRYEAVSMPYRNGGTDPRGWTRTKFDALNRPIEVRYFDGSAKPFPWESNATSTGADIVAYDADRTTATDPSGRERTSDVDGFGRLVQVREDPIGLAYGTSYEYDVLDNLQKVTQGSRIRDFEYTSLSRLKNTMQPETGTINYTYDNNGNLLTRGDARGIMTIGGYDALNRILSKSSNVANTPAVQYGYDACPWGKGRLCSVTATGVGGSSFEYDNMGRPVKKTQTIGAAPPYVMQQAYLPSGAVAWMTYPTGTAALPRKVSHEYWPNGQLKGVWQGDVATGSLYAAVNSYYAAGVEKSVVLGNQLLEDTLLNSRLQVAGRSIIHSNPTIKVLWSANYDYQNGAPNDGNLKVQTISGLQAGQALSFTQNYTYDSLSRLRTVKDSGLACGPDAQTSQKFVYDRYGNKAVLASSCGESSGAAVPFVATEAPLGVEAIFPANRLSNSNPDGSGNQQNWAGKTFVYDGENRLYQANVSGTEFYRYSYDGEGKRVKSQRFETPNVAKESTYYIYDASGQMIVETDGVTPLGANPERKYLTADHLGSTRLMTKSSGTAETIVESRYDYYPFGEEIARGTLGYGAAGVRVKFTGQARDGETGLDYMDFRYYGGAQGRFMSPDPLMASANVADPQSWNRYVYARNNPLRYNDPLGLFPSPAFNCAEGSTVCLNDEQRRILNASNIEIGGKSYAGEALYSKLNEKQQNAFVNNTDRLASIKVEGGGTALGMVQAITANPENGKVPTDRIYALVDPKLATSIGGSTAGFTKVDMIPGQHPGADLSYKSRDAQGNIQFSFNGARTVADIDHDLCTGGCHVAEATFNTLFLQKTDQNKVRELLIRMPGVGITPSPDPKFNRK